MNWAIEQEVRSRCSNRCEYCQALESHSKLRFVVDHIIAKQHGGGDELKNLALACGFCNRHKGPNIAGMDSESNQLSRLFHPRQDRWDDHFKWDGAFVVGITSLGRTTVTVLAMNHPWQIAVRETLRDQGVLP